MNPPNPPNPLPAAPPARGARAIRGPQSALTDFLASHNISANQIREDAHARRAAALASQQNTADDNDTFSPATEPAAPPRRKESKAQEAKRKKEEQKAIEKIKSSKTFKRRQKRCHDVDSDTADHDEVALALYQTTHAPLPGQMENCEICDKRFSVTAYSKAGPNGGLLCQKCYKELDKEDGPAKKKRKTEQGRARRQIQSNLLDGIYPGAKSLMTLCIETLVKNVHEAESFGDLPDPMVDRLARNVSRKRMMTSAVFDLFLRPGADSLTVTDCAKLNADDYIRIFQIMPRIKHLCLKNTVQFKNSVMDHLLGTTVNLESFALMGANLIDDERWDRYLKEKGSHLKSLKIYWTDGHFGDEQLELLSSTCPDLERLKIMHNQKVTEAGIRSIADLTKLTWLSLEITNFRTTIPSEAYEEVINKVGDQLKTLCLSRIESVDDTVLRAIHENCKALSKLRLVDNETFTDQGFADLFTDWQNPSLTSVNFEKCRHIDASNPRDNPDGVGFGSLGFEALMKHSGMSLKFLKLKSCRHISLETFVSVFGPGMVYPDLETLDVGFCSYVNDFVVGSIFRSCPKLKILKVFGNFGVKDVKVPKGRILIGVPNAMGMQIEGTEEGDGRIGG